MPDKDGETPDETKTPPEEDASFVSYVTDLIQRQFKKYQDSRYPIAERVQAGLRLLSAAGDILARLGEEKRGSKFMQVVRTYSPPRASSQVGKTVDDVTVRRIVIGGATGSTWDIALTDDPKPLMAMLENQRHEGYYINTLTPLVSYAMGLLAQKGIIHEKPPTLMSRKSLLTNSRPEKRVRITDLLSERTKAALMKEETEGDDGELDPNEEGDEQ